MLDFRLNHKYTKEHEPVIEFLPSNTEINYNCVATAKALAKNYRYRAVKLYNGTIEELKKVLPKGELIIIKDRDNNILDWNYEFYTRKEIKMLGLPVGMVLKAGHKLHNASKDFKMRQATGRARVERFKLNSMGIKENRKVF